MKKTLIWIIAIILYLATMVGALALLTINYAETFETQDISNYTCFGQAGCNGIVTSAGSKYAGSYGVEVTSTSIDPYNNSIQASTDTGVTGDIIAAEFMYYSSAAASVCGEVGLMTNVAGSDYSLLWTDECFGINGGRLDEYNNTAIGGLGSFTNGTCAALADNAWYNVTVSINKTGAGTWDIGYVVRDTGGTLKCQSVNETTQSWYEDAKWTWALGSGSGGATTNYYDDITLRSGNPATIASNFTVSAKDIENNAIQNFTAIVNGTSYPTTDGTAETPILQGSGNINITIQDAINNDGYYFNYTNPSVDTSSNYEATLLYQAEITFIATEKYSDDVLSGDFYKSTTIQSSPAHLLAVSQNISFVNTTYSPYKNTTYEFTFTALQNSSETQFYNVTNAVLNITPQSIYDNSSILNFTGWVYSSVLGFNETINVTDSSGYVELELLLNYNYTVHVENPDYAINDNNEVTLNLTMSPTQQILYLYDTNTIHFTFKDEETDTEITWENVTIALIGSLQSYNYTTSDGNYTATLLQPSDYAMRYSAPSYDERFYYFTLTNQSYNQLTLYLLNSTSSSNITVNVIDQTTSVVEGALVIAQRYYIAENAYKTVEIAETNFEGKAHMSLVMHDEFYKFTIEYDDEVVFVSTPTYITETELTFQVTIGEELLEDYDEYTLISGRVTYNNATERFTFTFNDADSLATQFCLHITRFSYSGSTIVNSSCTTTSSGSITLGFAHLNSTTYEAVGTFIRDSISYAVDVFSITTDETASTGVVGLILQVILTIAFAFMFMYVSPILTPIGVGLSLILGRLFILTSLSWPVLLGFMAGMIILTLWLGRND